MSNIKRGPVMPGTLHGPVDPGPHPLIKRAHDGAR